LATDQHFTDSQGNIGSVVTFKPPPQRMDPPMPENPNTTEVMQLMACNLALFNHSVKVDAQSKALIEPPYQKTSSKWEMWQPPPSETASVPFIDTVYWPLFFNVAGHILMVTLVDLCFDKRSVSCGARLELSPTVKRFSSMNRCFPLLMHPHSGT
jgi:hypothetical protein